MEKKYFTDFTQVTEAAGDALMLVHDGNGVKGIKVKDFRISLDDVFATGAGAHNGIYRGKNLGSSVTADQWAEISAGTFKDLYIGDYWVINSVNWRIAAFDYWLHCGDTECTDHHIVIVPDSNLLSGDGSTTHYMNTSNITTGGYTGTGFYSGTNADTTTNTAKATCRTKAQNAFGSAHILSHRQYLTTAVTGGIATAGAWCDSDIELMNEQNVYGCRVFGDVLTDTSTVPAAYTIDKSQFPLFALEPGRICNRAAWWLRDVVSGSYFAYVRNNGGLCSYNGASDSWGGIRPAFGIF